MPRKKGVRAKSAHEWQPVFLASLRKVPIIRAACQDAGITRAASYQCRERDPEFAADWDAAYQEGIQGRTDVLEAALWQRAQAKSDLLLIFALKALKPDVYGDRAKIDLTHHVNRDEVASAFRAFVGVVKRHVTDPDTLALIQRDFTATLESRQLELGA
jgi:hypothetical protein